MTASSSDAHQYTIRLTPLALQMLADVKDRRELQGLTTRIEQPKLDPEKQGKPLVDQLLGYRSVRAVGQRYRIVYKIQKQEIVVLIVGVGRRKEGDKKDIYVLLKRLLMSEDE